MVRPVFNPEQYCPSCGGRLVPDTLHSCAVKTLNAIDSAGTRDSALVRQPNLAERLKDGFELISEDEPVPPSEPEYRYCWQIGVLIQNGRCRESK
jgi:hypothetical protein